MRLASIARLLKGENASPRLFNKSMFKLVNQNFLIVLVAFVNLLFLVCLQLQILRFERVSKTPRVLYLVG